MEDAAVDEHTYMRMSPALLHEHKTPVPWSGEPFIAALDFCDVRFVHTIVGWKLNALLPSDDKAHEAPAVTAAFSASAPEVRDAQVFLDHPNRPGKEVASYTRRDALQSSDASLWSDSVALPSALLLEKDTTL